MNSSHWFPWPMLFFLFIIIYCPIVAGRLHSVKFPTQRTGNCSMASDFLGLIFTEAGGTCPLLALCAESAPGPCKPPVWGLPSRHPVQTAAGGTLPGSPTQPLGKAPLISAEYYVISFYLRCLLSFEPALWECSFQGRQWGTTEQTWWNHSAWSIRPSSGFIIRKQSTQPQYKRCFYTLWLLNYLLIKSFIASALSTTLNVGYKKYWGPIWDEPEDLKGS